MKQYGTAVTNFPAYNMEKTSSSCHTKTIEALCGSSYDRLLRSVRRDRSSSAASWWRKQITGAMANTYHCGGYGK